jgi:hypothetical protein
MSDTLTLTAEQWATLDSVGAMSNETQERIDTVFNVRAAAHKLGFQLQTADEAAQSRQNARAVSNFIPGFGPSTVNIGLCGLAADAIALDLDDEIEGDIERLRQALRDAGHGAHDYEVEVRLTVSVEGTVHVEGARNEEHAFELARERIENDGTGLEVTASYGAVTVYDYDLTDVETEDANQV